MLEALAYLLFAQLVGEIIVRAAGLPVPGPVVGLILMALVVGWRGLPANLHDTAHGLLRNLSLLFVPAGVGIIRQGDVLADYWVGVLVALAVSAVLTLTVTALVFRWAERRFGEENQQR
jgi:holin-like protein